MSKRKGAKIVKIKKTSKAGLDNIVSAILIFVLLLVCALDLGYQIISIKDNSLSYSLYAKYNTLKGRTDQLKIKQDESDIHVVPNEKLYSDMGDIRRLLDKKQFAQAQEDINSYHLLLSGYENQFALRFGDEQKSKQEEEIIEREKTTHHPINSVELPILVYHKTPENFEQILQHLVERGYQTVSMRQLANHLEYGVGLPQKPVVISFDDGFSDQLKAFDLLKKYNMKATFYVVVGGEKSNWCIGMERKNINCGDDYMTIDQIKMLDRSGVIEIGAHTIDHLNLSSNRLDVQSFEISESKRVLEHILSHPVDTFAYPYGAYNAQTVELVRQAGFSSAVTTHGGTLQTLEGILTLKRIRNALLL
jgi:peptidoglycan/xylan/chitin deacetylase (PgdA/CDA1 family)